MAAALNKYTIRKNCSEWMAPSADQNAIVSLTAKISQLKDNNLKLTSYLKKGPPKSKQNEYKKKGDQHPTQDKFKDGKGKAKPKRNKISNKEKWGWKTVPPKTGTPQTKSYQGKSYFWCRYHQAWTIHDPNLPISDPNSCHKKKEIEGNSSNSGSSNEHKGTTGNPHSNILNAIKEDEQE
jgi:hypothetical protein